MKKRALVSVSDKTNIIEVCKTLVEFDYEIISTGGTYSALKNAGVSVVNISEITMFPECLDGRVKTLHPAVHAGILAMRGNPEHMKQLADLNLSTIDLVIVNLYPFKKVITREGAPFEEAVENIDIGGPTMLRSAAKNYQDVVVIVDPADYDRVFSELKNGGVTTETKLYLQYKVYQHTAAYDAMIANYLKDRLNIKFPDILTLAYEKKEQLRYGENPHQEAAAYTEIVPVKNALLNAEQLQGKQLSYNNINDANGAVELLKEFDEPTVVAVKHTNPCGVASAKNIYEAYIRAYQSDPVSIFGGIVAANREIDQATAQELVKIFLEIVIAPAFSDDALKVLAQKPNLRVLKLDVSRNGEGTLDFKKCHGGLIIQDADAGAGEKFEVVTKAAPTESQKPTLDFAMKVVKHCKSNAIVIARDKTTLGIGVGQTNRIWAAAQAGEHSLTDTKGAVLASDAFFPFSDCVEKAAELGISAIIQPGGSVRDKDSIEACDKAGIAMVFTGVRHFKH
jgi:phosphoribosylaminoimidazolecarboxamide formyltransferase/IMP cyclohydrolase